MDATRPTLTISPRCTLVTLEFVRSLRGCDAESVRASIADATHPRCLRWVFDLSLRRDGLKRELRIWKEDALGNASRWMGVATVIRRILGTRERFARSEIEVAWTVHPTTISRLIGAGEITEVNQRITAQSLAAFLERRLQ
jgi:hypothetical protein